ncbi:MAG: hypothetical protein ACUVV1_04620 [Fimbriimonadales bacterium]
MRWWTPPQTLTTNAQGVASMRGFLGTYRLTTGTKTQAFELTRGKNEWVVRV